MPMIEAAVRQETFYLTQRPYDRDAIDVLVIRYTWGAGDRPTRAEHLTPAGWVDHGEGCAISPALSIPGNLAWLLARTPPYTQTAEVAAVEDLIAKVLGR